ncbi:UDP-N-acetylbacillosamine transaminase [Nitratiruptor sp. YY08-26]|uniref:aminotransferase class V-fold PLP-dependent enzyme n=1 Tax=unclassified Nitratiruptor TaxID=2624044 RepID=UPI0019154BC9|nr:MULTISPECIES: aminotransferase class V-fold PLP-dependent enzyme [unclassified Nitratiruptor]BCD61477.1 UDP-N-acetylbacillosamine transaminase [Nitratiruptor sp. YY08-13]BCD65411.1 UDP-N-acetylbacillosamine transaminase [Nitratiruptor sp. YY08-26]
MKIYLSPPHMSGKELVYIEEAFASNYIAPVGEFIDRFEEAVKEYTNAKYALALCNATAGIHLALRTLGIKEGDKVAVSDFTFIASLAPILYQKAKPILIDCDTSWQMDPEALEIALKREHPKAVIVTHLYGQSANIKEIANLCQKYGAHLIEDAAESLGARFEEKHTGTFGIFGAYSFNGNKILTTSGGGMLIGKDEKLMQKARFLSTQAKEPGYPWYEHETYGYNYRLSNILAAIGVAQMEVLDERIAKKREIFAWYQEYLQDSATFMPELPESFGNRWLTTALFETDPLRIYESLLSKGIESRPLWKPMHLQPLCKDNKFYGKGMSEQLFQQGLCLPSGTQLTKEQVEDICEKIMTVC